MDKSLGSYKLTDHTPKTNRMDSSSVRFPISGSVAKACITLRRDRQLSPIGSSVAIGAVGDLSHGLMAWIVWSITNKQTIINISEIKLLSLDFLSTSRGNNTKVYMICLPYLSILRKRHLIQFLFTFRPFFNNP